MNPLNFFNLIGTFPMLIDAFSILEAIAKGFKDFHGDQVPPDATIEQLVEPAYNRLPDKFKETATKEELENLLKKGIDFALSVKALFKH